MPAILIVIRFEKEIVDTDPTGAECDGCGDLPYLQASDCRVNVLVVETGQVAGRFEFYFCPTCAEVFAETEL